MDLEAFLETQGYPSSALKEPPAVVLNFGLPPERIEKGLAVHEEGRPLLLIDYAPGAVKTRGRELLAYARLAYAHSPPAVVVQTNGREFVLWETGSGKELASGGPEVIPSFETLKTFPSPPSLSPQRRIIEEKILFLQTSGG